MYKITVVRAQGEGQTVIVECLMMENNVSSTLHPSKSMAEGVLPFVTLVFRQTGEVPGLFSVSLLPLNFQFVFQSWLLIITSSGHDNSCHMLFP